jgi:signal transduction histidine kinase
MPPFPAFSRLSQRTRLVALFATLLAVLFVALANWLPERVDEQSRRLVEAQVRELARLTAASVEAALDFDDRVYAVRVLENLEQTREASYAILTREGGVELATWRRPQGKLPLPPEGGEELAYRDGLLHARVSLSTRLGHHGTLLLGFRLDELEAHSQTTHDFVAAVCFIVFAAGLVATFAIGTLLVRPLRDIAAVARRIAGGDDAAAADLPQGRGDEAGSVARALAYMLDRLYQQKATIEDLAARLEHRVAERTAQLEDANRELGERLSELKATQEQLIVADRRISIGRLAAGVAHEINNPLAYIKANLGYAADELSQIAALARAGVDSRTLQERLGELETAIAESSDGARRVQHIVRGLKTFARTDEDRRAPTSLVESLEAAIDMSAHELKHRARLERDISHVPIVDGNEVRLSQVFLNLLLNAAQAIPEGAPRGLIRVTLGTDGRGWAVAEVRDDGCGIPQEHLSRIFDPFFTTKPTGVGTGLGLSISQGIVLAMGGQISVESELGVGTSFRIVLPPSSTAQAEAPREETRPALALQARILVVDDEPLVGTAIRRVLAQRHRVTVAESGRVALDLIQEGAQFDHILCDLMMPEMTGMEFHAQLVCVAPRQADVVTFMTGGAFTQVASEFMERHPRPWLEKPLDPEELRRIIDGGN